MKINLAENLRKLRKENNMTQEELAERLNVSVGVVSKWERGASEPEISSLVAIAGVFKVSVDSLIGYNMDGMSPRDLAEKIAGLKQKVEIREALELAEEALAKYPNNLFVVYESAELYRVTDNVGFGKNYDKAAPLYKKAITLLSQDTEGRFSEMEMQTNIALCLLELHKVDEAIDVLKANNACGNSEDLLGATYIHEKKDYDEGLQHLAKAMLYLIERFSRIVTSGILAYSTMGKTDMAAHACNLFDRFTEAIAVDCSLPTVFDKVNAIFQARAAVESNKNGDENGARAYFERACECAAKCDLCSVQNVNNIMFACEIKKGATAFDNAGQDVWKSIELQLRDVGSAKDLAMWKETLEKNRKEKK